MGDQVGYTRPVKESLLRQVMRRSYNTRCYACGKVVPEKDKDWLRFVVQEGVEISFCEIEHMKASLTPQRQWKARRFWMVYRNTRDLIRHYYQYED